MKINIHYLGMSVHVDYDNLDEEKSGLYDGHVMELSLCQKTDEGTENSITAEISMDFAIKLRDQLNEQINSRNKGSKK